MSNKRMQWDRIEWPEVNGARVFRAESVPAEGRFALVVSRFNDTFTYALLASCRKALISCGVTDDRLDIAFVPGAYEIPSALARLLNPSAHLAGIALGCVVEGETPHADMINQSTARALMTLSMDRGIPVINEIVGVRNIPQAEARCHDGEGSRGWHAGMAAAEMAGLFQAIGSAS